MGTLNDYKADVDAKEKKLKEHYNHKFKELV